MRSIGRHVGFFIHTANIYWLLWYYLGMIVRWIENHPAGVLRAFICACNDNADQNICMSKRCLLCT